MIDFSELTAFIDSLSARYGIPGCGCAAAVNGTVVYRHFAGVRNEQTGSPASETDTYWIYSATKLFTCTAALMLYEKGLLDLDAPVSRYLPEFSELTVREHDGSIRPAKTILTIRHLMTMTGGLDYDLSRPHLMEAMKDPHADTRTIVCALSRDPLCFDPGTRFLYSLCHDVLGAVVEAASGMGLETFFRENIITPLGMRDTTFYPNADQLMRISTQYVHLDGGSVHRPMGQNNQYRFSLRYASGGAGLLSSVDDYIRLAAALSLGGTSSEGVQLLRPETVALYAAPALDKQQLQDFRKRSISDAQYSYGLGVRVRVDNAGSRVPLGTFGWDGAAGAYVLIDPNNHVALYYGQQVCMSPLSIHHIHPRLRELLYQCLDT